MRLDAGEPAEAGGVRMWRDVATARCAEACHVFGGGYGAGEPFAPLTMRVPA